MYAPECITKCLDVHEIWHHGYIMPFFRTLPGYQDNANEMSVFRKSHMHSAGANFFVSDAHKLRVSIQLHTINAGFSGIIVEVLPFKRAKKNLLFKG